MTQSEFIEKMVDILDFDGDLQMNTTLNDLDEWDSLSILSFLAEMGQYAKGSINAADVKKAKTIEDLYMLLS